MAKAIDEEKRLGEAISHSERKQIRRISLKASELVEILTRAQKEEFFKIMTRRNVAFHAESVYRHFYEQKLKKAKDQVSEIKKKLAKT